MVYIVLRLATNLSSDTNTLKELDRGLCESVGWLGREGHNSEEIYAIIIPAKKFVAEKKKGISDLLFARKEEFAITPQQLLFKAVRNDVSADISINIDAAVSGGYSLSSIRGGYLLCLTLMKDDPKRGRKIKSQFFRLAANVREEIVVKRKKATEAAVDDASRPKYKLEPVDLPMKEVSSLSWLYLKNEYYCAIVIDGRLSVASFDHLQNMRFIISTEVSPALPSPRIFASWKSDRLVVLDDFVNLFNVDLDDGDTRNQNPNLREKHFLWEVSSASPLRELST